MPPDSRLSKPKTGVRYLLFLHGEGLAEEVVSLKMTKFVAIGLLVLLAVAVLPLAMGGGEMVTCPSCPSAHSAMMFSICFAVLTTIIGFSLSNVVLTNTAQSKRSSFVIPTGLFKPPRLT